MLVAGRGEARLQERQEFFDLKRTMPASTATTAVGQSVVTISSRSQRQSAQVYLYGATLVSWKADGAERIFVSSDAVLNGSKAIRGGIPIAFPQFGTVEGSPLPQHGFARVSTWDWVGLQVDTETETTAAFRLTPDKVPKDLAALWPHPFDVVYTVTLLDTPSGKPALKTALKVANTGASAFSFTTLLHTYFAVKSIHDVHVEGLHGVGYFDKVLGQNVATDANATVTFSSEVDRVYAAPPAKRAVIREGGDALTLTMDGFKDLVVWNIWKEKAKTMADMNDEGYLRYVCVEAGAVAQPVVLEPGKAWEGHQLFSL
ncbi:galactose mutarotase-like domain-containing protein [Zopfochytrium polystomum]|nr:galactose mutarotase-like domain-containing protein [Zopfochytrium polystomum]